MTRTQQLSPDFFAGGGRLRRRQAVAERPLLPEDAGSVGQAAPDRAGYTVAR